MSIDAVIFRIFRKLGIDDADATAFADELNSAIDKRYALHAAQLATKVDLAEAKVEIIKWTIGSMLAAVGLFATITKLWH